MSIILKSIKQIKKMQYGIFAIPFYLIKNE